MKNNLLIGALLMLSAAAFAQNPNQNPEQEDPTKSVVIKQEGYQTPVDEMPLNELTFRQRLRIGGGVSGLQFGNPTSIGIAPMVGYQATPNLIVGGRLSYNYQSFNFAGIKSRFNLLGTSAFAMQDLPFVGQLLGGSRGFAQVEYEQFQNLSSSFKYRPALLAGVGINAGNGRGWRGINLTALYDFNYNSYDSFYGSPLVLRIGGFLF